MSEDQEPIPSKKNKESKITIAQPALIDKSFPIVGMGGSAGSFISFENFFKHMPADSGMAFIIVVHLDQHHKGKVQQIFQRYTPMKVYEALDGMQIEPNKVYVIPPNKDLGIHNKKLLLLTPSNPNGYRQPIDYFLQRLAEDQWNRAVAIIFSGMGSDGETGVRMIKEKLGMAMVQAPETALYNGMPLASIHTNLVDYVLAPEEMPIKLIQYMNHPALRTEASDQIRSEIQNTNSLRKILMLLRSHTGHDFESYKKNTITRRIDRRIAYHQVADYMHYVDFVRENPREIDVLFNELLIGVTKFFRDGEAFEALKTKLFNLLRGKKTDEPIRIWIAGCSTGEEAYSIAILMMECLQDNIREGKTPKIQIFATDLDAEAIEHARKGTYRDNIVADVSKERLNNYFTHKDNFYTIKEELREMVVFAQHNLIKDAPFTRLDLLCCRNVMIYLNADLQKKIIPVFHYSLNPKSILFMGPAETIGGFTDMFTVIDPKWKIFERKNNSSTIKKIIDFPFHISKQPKTVIKLEDQYKPSGKKTLVETFSKIVLDNFTPASVLITEKGDILFSTGKTGRYLELPIGEVVTNIHKMARDDLKYVLGNLIHQAKNQKGVITINDVKLKEENQVRLLNLKASMLEEAGLEGLMVVIFDDKGIVKKSSRRSSKKSESMQDAIVEELEKELVYAKQQLNNTVEQMETSLEELKSTNEELQSTNEELQSTNEESLTTKEEMQSLNEELMTVNMQYQSKAEELTKLNNDMKNLLDATEIGTIFLDNNLQILRYTPQVCKVFNLIPTDIGRPISHVVSGLDYDAMQQDINLVLDRLANIEKEIKTKDGEWYRVRIMPYRTLDNFISGTVLTFTLITPYKLVERKLNLLQSFYTIEAANDQEAMFQLDKQLTIVQITPNTESYLALDRRDLLGKSLIEVARKEWKSKELDGLLNVIKHMERDTVIKQVLREGKGPVELVLHPYSKKKASEQFMILVTIRKIVQ
jgi:two-component system CheB/CheR fusion protein